MLIKVYLIFYIIVVIVAIIIVLKNQNIDHFSNKIHLEEHNKNNYLFLKNKIIILITTSIILQDYDIRKEQYIQAITKLAKKYGKNKRYLLILIENGGGGSREFLESLPVDQVIYTKNNEIKTYNKGKKELEDILYFLNNYKIPNDIFIVKITGRYIIEDKCPFFDIVENFTNEIDAVAKFGFGKPTSCDTGLVGTRCGYVKQLKMPDEKVHLEELWGNLILSIPKEKVVKLSFLGIKTCPGINTYNVV